MTATAKKQKPLKRHPSKLKKMSAYMILTLILISIVAVLFAFPLYWIITGSFKTGAAINSTTPEWWPSQWVLTNYQKLFAGKSAASTASAVVWNRVSPSVMQTVPAAMRRAVDGARSTEKRSVPTAFVAAVRAMPRIWAW